MYYNDNNNNNNNLIIVTFSWEKKAFCFPEEESVSHEMTGNEPWDPLPSLSLSLAPPRGSAGAWEGHGCAFSSWDMQGKAGAPEPGNWGRIFCWERFQLENADSGGPEGSGGSVSVLIRIPERRGWQGLGGWRRLTLSPAPAAPAVACLGPRCSCPVLSWGIVRGICAAAAGAGGLCVSLEALMPRRNWLQGSVLGQNLDQADPDSVRAPTRPSQGLQEVSPGCWG